MLQRPDSIAHNTLERYTNTPLEQFGSFLLRTNFRQYANAFAARFGVEVQGGTWANAHAPGENLSLIDFGIGSPMAGLVMDVISHTDPSAVLMLGLCGGTDDDLEVGECVVPTASIRDEGPSAHYLPPTVPALPSLALNATICQALDNSSIPHRSGIMKTTGCGSSTKRSRRNCATNGLSPSTWRSPPSSPLVTPKQCPPAR